MSNNKETIQQIIALLSSLIDDNEPVETQQNISGKNTNKQKTSNNKVSRQRKSSKTTLVSNNKFLNMREMHMFKEDVEIDKKLKVMDPCPRTRSYSTINVRCRVCGKTENVNPTLVVEASRYKCNNCARSGG